MQGEIHRISEKKKNIIKSKANQKKVDIRIKQKIRKKNIM